MNYVVLFWELRGVLGMLFHLILSMNLLCFFRSVLLLYLALPKHYYCLVPLKLILGVFETITIYSIAKNVPNWSMDPISV